MSRPIKLWFEVAAYAITIAAALAIATLLLRLDTLSGPAKAVVIALPLFTAFFCVIAGIAVKRRRIRSDDPVNMSIKDEVDSRNSQRGASEQRSRAYQRLLERVSRAP
jgi:hypothetical protein